MLDSAPERAVESLFEMAQRRSNQRQPTRAVRRTKKLSPQVVLGQRGINLIERNVLEMGCLWNATGAIDVGIDGTIELCEPATHEPLGIFLHVQSKATDVKWEHETNQGFDYTCRPQDLDYWMQGNAPVLLIVSRPATNEVYWISVKDYFRDPVRRQSRRAHFDREKDQFTPSSYSALLSLAKPRDLGLYLAPSPRIEQLVSNLLEVRSIAPRLYLAETTMRRREEVWAAFQSLGEHAPSEWLLKEKHILSFHDLREFPWNRVCDRGSVEDFDTEEWAYSDAPDRRRDFVYLLNSALQERLYPEVRVWRKLGLYAFAATKDLKPRTIRYASHARTARRTVFEVYQREWNGQVYTHYRHLAFRGQFRLYEGRWYLEITPTFLYTQDGRQVHRRHSEWLRGIKRLDKNRAVLAQVLVWTHYLQMEGDLFSRPYPFLSFGRLLEFNIPVGIDDPTWQSRDETIEPDADDDEAGPLELIGS